MSLETPHSLLIVDALPAVREALRWALEDEPDLRVVGEAATGEEALARARELAPEVVILDGALAEANGLKLAPALKTLARPPLVIFLTLYGDARARARCLAAGGDGFAEKSGGWPTLIQAVRQALGNSIVP